MRNALFMTTLLYLFDASALVPPMVATGGGVKFTAVGKPGFIKINGESKGKAPTGQIELADGKATGEFDFDLKHLDTGIELRNEHMKTKYLEVEKFPTAKLRIHPLQLTEKDLKSDFKRDFVGTLTLHGVSKEINGAFDYTAKDKSVRAEFRILVSDFKIDIPTFKIVKVSESVDLKAEVFLK